MPKHAKISKNGAQEQSMDFEKIFNQFDKQIKDNDNDIFKFSRFTFTNSHEDGSDYRPLCNALVLQMCTASAHNSLRTYKCNLSKVK